MDLSKRDTSEIRTAISLICTHLTTEHRSKKHGGYDIYSDALVVLELDTYVPNIGASIKGLNGKPNTTVFSCGYHGTVYVYKPGAWETHVLSLVPEAQEALAESERKTAERKAADREKCFGPVSAELEAKFNAHE